MFNVIKSFILNTRIKIDYPRYEDERRKAHQAAAERRFDVSQLNKEVLQIKSQSIAAGDLHFGAEITSLRQQVTSAEHDLQEKLRMLSIFDRDYKSELDELYAQKNQLIEEKERLLSEARDLKSQRSSAYNDLQEAFDDIEDAKRDVDRWYAKSQRNPLFLGNGGRKLPKHSIFGQSHGDLSAAKSRQGAAASDIDQCKKVISDIKAKQAVVKQTIDRNYAEVGGVMGKIGVVKNDRQRMYDLRRDGVDPMEVRSNVQTIRSSLTVLLGRVQSLVSQRLALINENQIRLGLQEREATIADLLGKKTRLLQEFDSLHSQAIRREDHRQQWIASHS